MEIKENTNFDLLMENEIKKLTGKPKLLLHSCCAPCTSATLERLSKFFDVTVFYYNPNTFPETEYNLRAEQYLNFKDIKFIKMEYNHNEFLNLVKGFENEKEGGPRCPICFKLRLQKTFEYAKENGYDYVTTSLTISPHKNSMLINKIASVLENEFNIKYLYSDFKKKNGYKRSIELSKEYNLYRQDYCGCEFSKNVKK